MGKVRQETENTREKWATSERMARGGGREKSSTAVVGGGLFDGMRLIDPYVGVLIFLTDLIPVLGTRANSVRD